MPLDVETGLWKCAGCGGVFDFVAAHPRGRDGRLSSGTPVATTHEFIHVDCPHAPEDSVDGHLHEPYDHAALLDHCRRVAAVNRTEPDFPPDPIEPG
ncbi:MAG TPA: hypothetical protein VMU89_14765 [Thermomicrobiaceae bacterium]|nr:hypothetical protein [Thermomicrobiaceae bacterium]